MSKKKKKRFETSMRFQQPKKRQNQIRQFYAFSDAQIVCVTALIFYVNYRLCPRNLQ